MSLFAFSPVVTVGPFAFLRFPLLKPVVTSSLNIPPDRSTVTNLWHLNGELIFSSCFILDEGRHVVPKLVGPSGVLCSYRPEHGIKLC